MKSKKLLPTIALLLACCPSAAQKAAKVSDHDACELIARYAGAVMFARQTGVDVTDVMRSAREPSELKREMILDAYSKPRWGTQERRLQAERDFKNDTYVRCMRS